jgi:hypothetical protein
MKVEKSTPWQDEFENVLVGELEQLRKSERALQRMYLISEASRNCVSVSCSSFPKCSSVPIAWTRS